MGTSFCSLKMEKLKMEKFWRWMVVMAAQHREWNSTPLHCTRKTAKLTHLMLCFASIKRLK